MATKSYPITLLGVPVSYAEGLFEARAVTQGSAVKYSATFLLPPDYDWTEMTAACNQAIADMFGANPPQDLKYPWLDKFLRLSQEADGPYAGWTRLSCYANQDRPPELVDQWVRHFPDLATGRRLIFSGALVNVRLGVFAYNQGGHGISCGINNVQLVDGGDHLPRLDGRKTAAEIFTPIDGAPPPVADVPGVGGMRPAGPTGAPAPATAPGAPAQPPPVGAPPAPAPAPAPGQPVPGQPAPAAPGAAAPGAVAPGAPPPGYPHQ